MVKFAVSQLIDQRLLTSVTDSKLRTNATDFVLNAVDDDVNSQATSTPYDANTFAVA